MASQAKCPKCKVWFVWFGLPASRCCTFKIGEIYCPDCGGLLQQTSRGLRGFRRSVKPPVLKPPPPAPALVGAKLKPKGPADSAGAEAG